jgi:hypothetical protein
MSHEQKKNGMFTEAITLALIPAIGFGLAWLNERGFCDVHNIPVNWIQLDTTQIISASVKTAATLMIFLFILNQMTPEIKDLLSRPEKRYSILGVFMLTLVLTPYMLYAKTFQEAKPTDVLLPLVIAGLVLVSFMHPNFLYRDLTFTTEFLGRFPVSIRIGVLVLILASQVSYYLGVREAKIQKWFLVPDNTPDLVLLRKYGDQVIMGRFDQKKRLLEPVYTLQSLGDADPMDAVKFNYKKVGPLKPWKKDD